MTGDMSAARRQRLREAKAYAREEQSASRKKAAMFADYYNLRWRRNTPEPPFGSVWDSWPRKDEA